MESSSVNALKRSCFKSVEGNGKSIALKCIFKTYRFGNVSWELHAHVLKYYKQCTPINIFGVHDRDSVENWPVWKRHHSLLWNLPLPLFFSDIFFAGILLLGGPSAFCMPATRTADAKHLKPCFKDSPRNTAINHRILYRCGLAFTSAKVRVWFSCSSAGSLSCDWLKLIPVYMRTQVGSY